MDVTSGLVLLAVIWFMVFFVVLPLRLTTQGEAGDIVPGTHSSAPENPNLGRKARIATIWAVVIWGICVGVILSGVLTVEDLDFFGRMRSYR